MNGSRLDCTVIWVVAVADEVDCLQILMDIGGMICAIH